MDKNFEPLDTGQLTTVGIGHFGEGAEAGQESPPFRVVAGRSLEHAIVQATVLMCAVHKTATWRFQTPTLLTAMYYLSGMAKALVQDVSHGVMVQSQRN